MFCKSVSAFRLGAACAVLTAALLSFDLPVDIKAQESPDPTNPAFSWELPEPSNLPAGPEQPAVIYRIVHETVYAACPLYVRSGPGSQYDYIGKLEQGEVVRRGAVGNNGWSQILYKDKEAYVSSIHLSVSPIDPDPYGPDPETVYQKTDDSVTALCVTKLRRGPGNEYAVIGHLTKGSGAIRMAVGDNGWSKLLFHDTIAYACTGDLLSSAANTSVTWQETDEEVYAASDIPLWLKPSHSSQPAAYLPQGKAAKRLAVSSDGWSHLFYQGMNLYAGTAYLSEDPERRISAVETSQAELPTPNAPFIYQYMAPDGIMPHAFFTPVSADLSKPLPLIISLHGALEIGEAPNTLKHNFITREILNWEYTGLDGFDAYVVCPQLTGYGYGTTWRDYEVANKFFALIDYLKKTYKIDEDHIILEGHSLGGEGVFYMAADYRADFSAVVPISGYNASVSLSQIHSAVRGYNGSPYIPSPREDWTSYNFMKQAFENHFGGQNWFVKNCSHYDIPMVAVEEDLNNDGKSDLIEWMLAQ